LTLALSAYILSLIILIRIIRNSYNSRLAAKWRMGVWEQAHCCADYSVGDIRMTFYGTFGGA
jgi:hypothetical protein